MSNLIEWAEIAIGKLIVKNTVFKFRQMSEHEKQYFWECVAKTNL